MKRCFVALVIAEQTREALACLQDELRRVPNSAARRVRPVKERNLHLTLKFMGDTPNDQIPEVIAALETIAFCSTRSGAIVEGVGAFPSIDRPRAIFGALGSGREAVAKLGDAIEAALEPLGFEPESRQRVPHVTIARVEGAKRRGALSRWIENIEPTIYGPVLDETLVLYESELDPGGSIYTPLATLPLGAA